MVQIFASSNLLIFNSGLFKGPILDSISGSEPLLSFEPEPYFNLLSDLGLHEVHTFIWRTPVYWYNSLYEYFESKRERIYFLDIQFLRILDLQILNF